MPLLEVTHLSVGYMAQSGVIQAVRDVSLSLLRGEVLGVVGESGSGKSTLAHAIMGYRSAGTVLSSGSVRLSGISLLDAPPSLLRRIWGQRVAMIHQNPLATLTPTMRVGDQVIEVVRRHRSTSSATSRHQMIAALEAVNLPSAGELARRYPHELSGGERQRISIAIALCLEPDLLILDEPTTNLDATTEASILDLLEDIKGRLRAGMIYITHNLGVIARISDRVAVMYSGEIVETGATRAILSAPGHPYTQALLACVPRPGITKRHHALRSIPKPSSRATLDGGCRFRDRCSDRSSLCEVAPEWSGLGPNDVANDKQHVVRCWHSGSGVRNVLDPSRPVGTSVRPRTDIVLDAVDITKRFSKRSRRPFTHKWSAAVSSASIRVPQNSIVGLVGESGSGKSTLLRCIAGLETPDNGTISFMGVELPRELTQRPMTILPAMQMIFQDPESTLNPALTVGENLRRHLQALRAMSGPAASREIGRALEQVRLNTSYRDRLPRELSGGEKQRVAIARAFLSHPKLVLCDEPLSSLDVSVQSAICQLLLDLQQEDLNSYIFVSHDLSVVRYLSDYIVVMYLGEAVEVGDAESFDHLPLHPYTEALFSAIATPDPDATQARIVLSGQVSAIEKTTAGCIFSVRCHRRKGEVCVNLKPPWQQVGERQYRCHWTPSELVEQQRIVVTE